MTRLDTRVFGPMITKIEPEFLPDKNSRKAVNLRLRSGALQGIRAPVAVAGLTAPTSVEIKTLYRYGKDVISKTNFWMRFSGDVDIVRGAVRSDTEERTYWTDGTYPKKTKSDIAGLIAGQAIAPSSLRMGVPPPGWAGPNSPRTYTPGVSVTGAAVDPASESINSAYVVTYVTTWGEESAPSVASAVVSWRVGQTVRVTLPGVLAGAYSWASVRIYRSNSGSARASYQLLTTLPVATAFYDDSAPATALQEGVATWDFTPPPDGLKGLVDMGNGFMAGFDGNTVYFSEPNYPYAWPAKYDFPLTSRIVGMRVFGQTLVVCTVDGVVLLTGSDPASMSEESPKGLQSCVSKRSMVGMMGGVVYAGTDGLYLVGPGVSRNLTESIMSVDEWRAYKPESFHAYNLNGDYIAFYDTGTVKGSLIFNFGEDAGFVECDEHASAAYVEDANDTLFINTFVGATNTIREWDAGASKTVLWRSKDFRSDMGMFLARARVVADSYPVTFRLYAGGALKHTQTVLSPFPFALPDGKDFAVSYEIESSVKVRSVTLASSMKEMAQ